MSAFYVGAAHVNAMLSIIRAMENLNRSKGLDRFSDDELTEVGKMLLAENVKSLKARYPADWFTMIDEDINRYRFRLDVGALAALKTEDFRLLGTCYRYQSCEHDGWDSSKAREFVLLYCELLDNGKDSDAWHYQAA